MAKLEVRSVFGVDIMDTENLPLLTRILLIDDDDYLRSVLSSQMRNKGVTAFAEASRASEAFDQIDTFKPDLILLDMELPDGNGLDICQRLRAHGFQKPIIMLTGQMDEEDIVKGLETGADDYITKPFSIKVLIARVNAVLKRSIEVGEDKSKDILINGINIKTRSREVWVNKNPINDLTFSEFQILYLLAGHPGWVFTRYQIIDKIRGDNYPVTDRSVDFQIVGLRKKLGDAGKLIKTVRGVGYRFTPDEK